METSKAVNITPEGYTAITPWIISPSSEKLIVFLKDAFDAQEIPNSRITNDVGQIIHVVVKIGDAHVMLFDAREGWAATPTFLNLYVTDIEKTYRRSLELGAQSVTDITLLWFGAKVCRILDPFGNLWWINQRVEEVDFTNPEIAKRAATPEAKEGIAYIQRSLDKALKAQKAFFEIPEQ
ncbi:VOC family protein [Dyadobacter crusticola]|uniref:VOC family protein n=1 Tax=Dyadobacter crusticola TaxID=292407 RepID=UPI0004E1B2E7|nr:VOC family protein [Dyadobacter crusticola]